MRCSGVFIALLAVTASCAVADHPAAPEENLPELPRLDMYDDMDCQLTDPECAILRNGIGYLEVHANPMCRIIGARALTRFNSTSGEGYRPRPQETTHHMSVYMTTPSSYTPLDGYTNVHPSFFTHANTGPQATGGVIAHEESHHMRQDNALHASGQAQRNQDMCLNPQG